MCEHIDKKTISSHFCIILYSTFTSFLWQPHFEASVRMKLTFPIVGTWSPPGLPQFQSSTAEVKTPCLEMFFILLERPWNVDVENGLAWAIWKSVTQVMVKRGAGSKTGSLTPDHKKGGNRPDPGVCRWSATHRWKALEDSYKFAWDLIPIRGLSRELWVPKVSGVQTGTVLELLFGSPENKSHLDAGAAEQCIEYYMGEGGGFPQVRAMVSKVSPCCPWLVPTPRVFLKVN
jgi:hypothetical protein